MCVDGSDKVLDSLRRSDYESQAALAVLENLRVYKVTSRVFLNNSGVYLMFLAGPTLGGCRSHLQKKIDNLVCKFMAGIQYNIMKADS